MAAPKAYLQDNPNGQSVLFGGVYINELKLAKAQNISQAHVSRVLGGTRTPSVRIALQLAAALGLTIDELLENINERRAMLDQRDDETIARYEARLKQERRQDTRAINTGRIPVPRLTQVA